MKYIEYDHHAKRKIQPKLSFRPSSFSEYGNPEKGLKTEFLIYLAIPKIS